MIDKKTNYRNLIDRTKNSFGVNVENFKKFCGSIFSYKVAKFIKSVPLIFTLYLEIELMFSKKSRGSNPIWFYYTHDFFLRTFFLKLNLGTIKIKESSFQRLF